MITLTLPYPPSVNHYWGMKGMRRFVGKKGMEFRKEVSERVAEAGYQPMTGKIAVFVALYPPDRRTRDLDNVTKALLDALQHAGCFEDDSDIDDLHLIRQEVQKGGSCTVVITPIE